MVKDDLIWLSILDPVNLWKNSSHIENNRHNLKNSSCSFRNTNIAYESVMMIKTVISPQLIRNVTEAYTVNNAKLVVWATFTC